MEKKKGYIGDFLSKKYYLYIFGILVLLGVDYLQIQIPIYLEQLIDGVKYLNEGMDEIVGVIKSILLLAVGMFVLRFFWRYFIIGTSRKFERYVRSNIFKKLLSLSPAFYDKTKTGDIMARTTNDLNATRMMLAQGVIMLTDSIILGSLSIYMMITRVDLRLTLIGIIPLPILAIVALSYGGTIHKRFESMQKAFSNLTDTVQETIDGMQVVKSYTMENERGNTFFEKCQDYFKKSMRLIKLWGTFLPLIELMSTLGMALTIWYGGRLVILGEISLGQFVAFSQYLMMLVWPIMAIGWVVNVIQRGRASYKRIMWIENQSSEVMDPNEPKKADLSKEIKVKDLSFTYPGSEKRVLHNINLHINPGQTVAFVGKTGSGKSTLAKLLVKMYSVKNNHIYIGDYDINQLRMKEIREQVAYVPQETFLFSATITENIGFSVDNYSQEDVEQYAHLAAVHSNIQDFPQGYKTIVGERGVSLSGGQKQRVAIARALMKKTPVVILDDCLSAVDTETELRILDSLNEEIKNRTTIIISHRLKAVSRADRIFVFDEGKIVESGTHHELLETNGHYSELYNKQLIEEEFKGGDNNG
ncbi:MAG: ATP-binding cassette, subfamily multidrug efflux pump [Thermotogaceae bacterium]|jgi:ATP-binding cassette subfamily B protein|nr:ATP-binding cassette, subfamily multidrug efflux pump [Thermotogaceae bacterium]